MYRNIMGSIRSRSLEENFHTIWQETLVKRTQGNTNIKAYIYIKACIHYTNERTSRLWFFEWLYIVNTHDIRSLWQVTKEMEIGSFIFVEKITYFVLSWAKVCQEEKNCKFFSCLWMKWMTGLIYNNNLTNAL